ncbi:hypothetical protein [Collinsella intestinalis]|uniref:hypothetical protein n=1 Tax=Collinsella intestinalis TaxID=147207 RepID=UPI00195D8426|nr:hypothetical protein [Collinsella intestinalis]MBM6941553.1 hypothetical protein [Collinsella intestinalis]
MSLMQTITEVTKLRREIQDEVRQIEEYRRANRYSYNLVQSELAGSQRSFDRIMLASIERSEKSLDRALAQLRRADEALNRVASI